MSNTGTHRLPFVPRPSKSDPQIPISIEPMAAVMPPPPSVIVQPPPATMSDHQRFVAERLVSVQEESTRLAAEEKRIESEIAAVKETMALYGKRHLPLAKMLIASPCDQAWAKMTGDDKTRFCHSCQKSVHNLSAMTSVEVEDFLEKQGASGSACVRLYERTDGTVLTADCPVGVSRRRTRNLLVASLGAGVCSLFAFTAIAVTMSVLNRPAKIVEVQVPGPTVYVPSAPPPPTVNTGPNLPATGWGKGWVLIHAPEGTNIYEGQRLLGTGALVILLPEGKHSLRAELKTGTLISSTAEIEVKNMGNTDVVFRTEPRRLMGAVVRR